MRRYWRSHAPTESLLASSQGAASTSRSQIDRKSTRLNSSHSQISYAVFCLKKKKRIAVLVTHYDALPCISKAFSVGACVQTHERFVMNPFRHAHPSGMTRVTTLCCASFVRS